MTMNNDTGTERVYVVDDDDAARESLATLLQLHGFVVRPLPSAEALLAEASASTFGCVLLDLRMPGRSGLEAVAELRDRGISLPVVIVTGHGDVSAARSAFLGGVVDFLEKPVDETTLLKATSEALERDRVRRSRGAADPMWRDRAARLTSRERQVMLLACEGYRNNEIAAQLGISHRTVEVHKAHLMEKLEVRSLAELLQIARSLRGSQE